jgi:hypothetical protein
MRLFTDKLHDIKDEATLNLRIKTALENSLPDRFCYKKIA